MSRVKEFTTKDKKFHKKKHKGAPGRLATGTG